MDTYDAGHICYSAARGDSVAFRSRHALSSSIIDEQILKHFPEAASLVTRYLVSYRNSRHALAGMHRRFFRVTGFWLIVASVSLPAIAGMKFPGQAFAIATLSVIVAAATALRSFFRWEQKWQIYRSAEVSSAYLIAEWEIDMLELLCGSSSPSREAALNKTRDILFRAKESTDLEFRDFFDTVSWPAGTST